MKKLITRPVKFCTVIACCLLICACATTQPVMEAQPDEDAALTYDKARNLQATGSEAQAYDMYLSIYHNYPQHGKAPEALYAAALIADKTSPRRAVDLYEKYLADYPNSGQTANVREKLFLDYMNLHNYQQASSLFGSIYATHPDKKWTGLGLGLIDSLRQQEASEAALNVIAAIYPNSQGDVRRNLRKIWESDLEKITSAAALANLEKNVTDPELLEILLAREAKIYLETKDESLAQKVMSRLGGLGIYRGDEDGVAIRNSIGVILPLSGKWEAVGQKILNGVAMASGVFALGNTPNVEYIIRDYGSDPERIPQIIDELDRNSNILAVIGPVGEAAGNIAAKTLQQKGIPGIMFNRAELEPQEQSFSFNNFVSIETEVRTLLGVAAAQNITRFAVLYPNDNFGNLFTRKFEMLAPDFGIEVVRKVAYSQRNVDFKQEIASLSEGFTITTDAEGKETKIPDFNGLLVPDSAINAGMVASYLEYSAIEGVTLFGPITPISCASAKTTWTVPSL